MKMKNCTKCGEWKGLDEYHVDSKAIDGHFASCKVCQRKASRDYYWANREKVIAKQLQAYHDKKAGIRRRKAGVGLEDRQVQIYI